MSPDPEGGDIIIFRLEKFRKFKVPNKGPFVSTERQTDGRKGKINMSPYPEGGGGDIISF